MSGVRIVPYEPKYRDLVRRCVYETGFGGEGAQIYFEDPVLFADINILYYTDYEPESAFIGLVDGEPAGYLLGCVDTKRCIRVIAEKVSRQILSNLLRGRYNLGPGVRRYFKRGALMAMRGEVASAPIAAYPAHLHIDLFKQFRRVGLGGMLMQHYFEYLRSRGAHGLHLATSSFHVEGIPFYEKLGFRRYAVSRVRDSFFSEIVDKDFYNMIYVKYV